MQMLRKDDGTEASSLTRSGHKEQYYMGNINYDSFYKFLVSLGIILTAIPFIALICLFTNSFDLQIPQKDLATYTETAQRVIDMKQSIPLLIINQYVLFAGIVLAVIGVYLIFWGLKKWYTLQKLDDICKEYDTKTRLENINNNTKNMTYKEIINKDMGDIHVNSDDFFAMKALIVEQRFFNWVQRHKPTHIVKSNIIIENLEYDVVAFSKERFDKDYVFEAKYLEHNVSIDKIDEYRENMKSLKKAFSDKFNHSPYMVLTIIVSDKIYEQSLTVVKKMKKWNNYSIEVIKETDLIEINDI